MATPETDIRATPEKSTETKSETLTDDSAVDNVDDLGAVSANDAKDNVVEEDNQVIDSVDTGKPDGEAIVNNEVVAAPQASPEAVPSSVTETTAESPSPASSPKEAPKTSPSKSTAFVHDPDKITLRFLFAGRDGTHVSIDFTPTDTVGEVKGALMSVWPEAMPECTDGDRIRLICMGKGILMPDSKTLKASEVPVFKTHPTPINVSVRPEHTNEPIKHGGLGAAISGRNVNTGDITGVVGGGNGNNTSGCCCVIC